MTTTDPIVKALLAERYSRATAMWWKTPRSNRPAPEQTDDDVTCRRRLRQLVAAAESVQEETG